MVAGVQTSADALHPVEIYYGNPQYNNLQAMLDSLGLEVNKEDKVDAFPLPIMGMGSRITIQRALPVEVTDAKKTTIYRTWAENVSGLLTENNIELMGKDSVEPGLDTQLTRNMQVKITRVEEFETTQDEIIPFKTISKNDSNMNKGETRVEKPGKNGKKTITYQIRRENGVEVYRKKLNEKIIEQPQDKIVYVGTKVVVLGRGKATWYDLISGMTAAHNTLPRYSYVKVTAVRSGKSVVVKIIDRGIYSDAIIDLSADAFSKLAPLGAGVIEVILTVP